MDDAGVGRHDAEVVEGVLAPPQKRVALLVAGELELRVQLKGVGLTEIIDLHRVIDDELDRLQRIDSVGSPPSRAMPSRIAARSTTAGTPVKSCSSTRAGANEISFCAAALQVPRGQRLDVGRPSRIGRPRGAAGSRAGSSSSTAAARSPGNRRSRAPAGCTSGRRRPPTASAVRVPKLFTVDISAILRKGLHSLRKAHSYSRTAPMALRNSDHVNLHKTHKYRRQTRRLGVLTSSVIVFCA